jgi:single-strand DNA-binding protein
LNETLVTVIGWVASEPQLRLTPAGVEVASFRFASTERRFDRASQTWQDADTIYLSVACWRRLAGNVMASVEKGQPLVVHGKLRYQTFEVNGQTRNRIEVDAVALGHDMSRGQSQFRRVTGAAAGPRPALESVPTGTDTSA